MDTIAKVHQMTHLGSVYFTRCKLFLNEGMLVFFN